MTERKRNKPSADPMAALRREAEKRLRTDISGPDPLSDLEVKALVHELRTHQIELEMQNEELWKSQQELEESRRKYSELYDLAPVGYFTFDKNGLILDLNLTGANQAGRSRKQLQGIPFSLLIREEHRSIFFQHLREVFSQGSRRSCELAVLGQAGKAFFARLDSIAIEDGGEGVSCCLTTVSDITEKKRAEDGLVRAKENLELSVRERTMELLDIKEDLEVEIIGRRKNEDVLDKTLKEKETLLRELYHRTKNNMNVISSLISLQTAPLRDKEVLQMFIDIQNRIKSMALVHQKLYQAGDLCNITIKDYISDLAQALLVSYGMSSGRVALNLKIEDFPLSIESAIPCGLILNELISNSLKYAFPEGRAGEISIEAGRAADGEIRLRYRDNGIGLPEMFDFRNSRTMGMNLIRKLAEGQLGGRVELKTDSGAEFAIAFLEPHYTKRI